MNVNKLFASINKEHVLNVLYKSHIDNNELYKNRPDIKEKIKNNYNILYDSIFNNSNEINENNNNYLIVLKEMNNKELLYTSFYICLNEIKQIGPLYNSIDLNDEYISRYGLLFVEWNKILSMNICEKSLENYPKEEILAHILWEMTFFGNENNIEEEKDKLLKNIEELENKPQKYFTIEECLERIYKKYGIKKELKSNEEILIKKEIISKEMKENKKLRNDYIISIFKKI